MIHPFPYNLLDKAQICEQMNQLGASSSSFFFVVNFDASQGYVIQKEDLDEHYIRFDFNATDAVLSDSVEIKWLVNPISIADYQPKFDFVVSQIHKGNSFLTNLTQPTKISTNLSLIEIYQKSTAKYKLWLKGQFAVLSPETFVKIENGIISSFPMKGTIDATIAGAKEEILSNAKEKAEHATIVDLIRNDLSLVASGVEVKRYRYTEEIKANTCNLLQVSSEISGRLPEKFHEKLGDIIFSLLPAGSISGAPKPKTLEIIKEAEGYDRGFYTGICGWFDGVNLDSAVMIRFIEQAGDDLIFKSGGGITSQSELQNEYEELIQKVYVPIR